MMSRKNVWISLLALVALMTVGDAAKVSHASKSVLRPTTSERNKMISYENQKMKAQLSSKRQHLRESIKKKHADRKAHNDAAQKKSQLSASKRRLAMGNVKVRMSKRIDGVCLYGSLNNNPTAMVPSICFRNSMSATLPRLSKSLS